MLLIRIHSLTFLNYKLVFFHSTSPRLSRESTLCCEATYTTARMGSTPSSAPAGHKLLRLHPAICTRLESIRRFTSSMLQTRHLLAILPDYHSVFKTTDDVQWNVSCNQPKLQRQARHGSQASQDGQLEMQYPALCPESFASVRVHSYQTRTCGHEHFLFICHGKSIHTRYGQTKQLT